MKDEVMLVDISKVANSAQALNLLKEYMTTLVVPDEGMALALNCGGLLITQRVFSKMRQLVLQSNPNPIEFDLVYATLPQTQQAALDSGLFVREQPQDKTRFKARTFLNTASRLQSFDQGVDQRQSDRPQSDKRQTDRLNRYSSPMAHAASSTSEYVSRAESAPSKSYYFSEERLNERTERLSSLKASIDASMGAYETPARNKIRQFGEGPSLPFGDTMSLDLDAISEEFLTPMPVSEPLTSSQPLSCDDPCSLDTAPPPKKEVESTESQDAEANEASTKKSTKKSKKASSKTDKDLKSESKSSDLLEKSERALENLSQSDLLTVTSLEVNDLLAIDDDAELESEPRENECPTLYLEGTLRSGRMVRYDGNLVVVGDVHGGSELCATGDILIWGELRGIAHAGADGNEHAKIRALKIEAIQLRIADVIARRPDRITNHKPNDKRLPEPEVARVTDGEIKIFNDVIGK